eukprot:TCONS_00038712-protein
MSKRIMKKVISNVFLSSIKVTVKCIICDAPARAFLKQTINHTGYYSCERCCIKGSWDGRVVFNSIKEEVARTDNEFARIAYSKHQKGKTPLIEAGIKCISQFPLDYMHLICLGVVKRILFFLKTGPYRCRISASQVQRVPGRPDSLSGKIPTDLARQPRVLKELKRWKATEFRQFLLYTVPVVLSGILNPTMYTHFLSLSVAVSILLSSDSKKRNHYLRYAGKLLKYFVANCKKLYGSTFTVYNVHNLQHIADDVKNYNCSLNEISAFPFENFLQTLKKMVRNSKSPLIQVSNRLCESRSLFPKKT